ncbi:MAG: PQQ-dependent sugar dehydrogenase [Phycisphaerales bacterium]|nr:PQQ-dependent sugar dehydrogenase [Phycisphaerales bacterium]MCB9856918.1 PQQ-dependent sugar dehydrogenase [Phycisphaerales bacterium]MCB9861955.1 PQQ-dependent sugar dehydrogenase [Phycisphaerales bacterium]
MCITPDGRIFIGMQDGRILIWKEGQGLLPTPFHTLAVSNDGAEGGLIGMALDPDFATTGFVFVHYTQFNSASDTPQKVTRISASAENPDIAAPNSEITVFEFQHEMYYRHNAGGIRFGPDGKLYVAIGDKQTLSSQSLQDYLGKILRLNKDGSIPNDNPTTFHAVQGSTTGPYRAIWAIGLRNPFRFAFDSESGRMLINDVGVESWEEIDEGGPGRNYGWPATEGDFDSASFPGFSRPVFAYPHGANPSNPWVRGNAILAGAFYEPSVCTFPPEYYGKYFFSDFRLFVLDPASNQASLFSNLLGGCTDLHVDDQGRLVMIPMIGRLIRLEYTDPLPPVVVRQPEPKIVCNGDAATVNLVVSTSLPVTYQWQHNGIPIVDTLGIAGSQTRELTIASIQPVHSGNYSCVITNAYGQTETSLVTIAVGPASTGYNGTFIQSFTNALLTHSQESTDLCQFDFDANGTIDPNDIPPLITALLTD